MAFPVTSRAMLACLLIAQCMSNAEYSNQGLQRRSKRNIIRRITSCPEDCTCEVMENNHKYVDCFNSRKTGIPQDIPGDAVALNLSRNLITTVKAGLLDNLRDIETLDLSHNSIKDIQRSALKDLTSMRVLDLSFNKLRNISLDDLRQSALNLEVLNISSTDVREVPELHDSTGLYMSKLTHLSMAQNFFTSIPPSHIPPSVIYLDISCLHMRELKNTALSGLDNLEEIIMRGCPATRGRIKSVEHKAFATSVKLKRLDLAENDLVAVPTGLPTSLHFLDLSGNKITTIKKTECATELDMQSRLYVTADGSFDEFGDGQLTRPVGTALSRLSNLQELRLNGNPIASLCMDEFLNLEKLKILNMTGCRVSSFHPHTFVYPRTLQILDLSKNQMMHFKTENLAMLEELYLQHNILENVGGLNRMKVPSLQKADLSGNPWRCNCEIKPLLQLIGYHSNEIDIVNLHAYSVHYACSVPLKVKGKPLLTLDLDELTCDDDQPIDIATIAAPASLGLIIVVIVIVIVVAVRRDSKKRAALRAERGIVDDGSNRCCSCCCACCHLGKHDYSKTKSDSRSKFDYPRDTLVRKNALLDDAAILCNAKDQKWVINKMIPEIHRYREDPSQKSTKRQQDMPSRKLNMNVFTIGQTIKIERLSKCIDSNRKIILVVTHNFVEEDSSVLLLNVIRERMVRDPKDSVILLILDAIAWSTMPQCLQCLMVEKTFVQYPQDCRGRQEFYFWDSVCSHMYSKSLRNLLPPVEEQNDNPAFDEDFVDTTAYNPPPVVDQPLPSTLDEDAAPPMRPANWNTGGRKMKGLSMNDMYMSPEREAKLNRLGIQRDGHLKSEVFAGANEARNLGREQKRNIESSHPSYPSNLPMQHIEAIRSRNEDIASVHRDIDDLYSTRKTTPVSTRVSTSGRIRSLLPAHAEDADSIYSDEEEIATPMIRAPERQRSIPVARTSHLHSVNSQTMPGISHHRSNDAASLHRGASVDQLHGTDKTAHASASGFSHIEPIEETAEPIPPMEEEEAEACSDDGKSKKKKKKNKKSKKKSGKKDKK